MASASAGNGSPTVHSRSVATALHRGNSGRKARWSEGSAENAGRESRARCGERWGGGGGGPVRIMAGGMERRERQTSDVESTVLELSRAGNGGMKNRKGEMNRTFTTQFLPAKISM